MMDRTFGRKSWWRMLLMRSPSLWFQLRRSAAAVSVDHRSTTALRLRSNFALAFPRLDESGLNDLVERHWGAALQAEADLQHLTRLSPAALVRYCRERVQLSGHLQAILQSQEPVVFFTPHYGAFAIACLRLVLELEGRKPVSVFYDPPDKNPTTGCYEKLIGDLGTSARILYNDKSAVLKGLRSLRNGGALALMPDVYDPTSSTACCVPFFGRLATAMNGTAFFAIKGGARLVPVYCRRTSARGFEMTVEKPLQYQVTGDFDRDLYFLTARIFENIQARIAEAPEHWFYWSVLHKSYSSGVTVPASGSWRDELSTLRARLSVGEEGLRRLIDSMA